MAEAGFIDTAIVTDIYASGWNLDHEDQINNSWIKHNVYITNLVKCTQPNPENPSKQVIAEDIALLSEEINLVDPQYIVAFGKLPIFSLTGKDVKLADYLAASRQGSYAPLPTRALAAKSYNLLPCYFPVGRGNPPKAIEMLKHIKSSY